LCRTAHGAGGRAGAGAKAPIIPETRREPDRRAVMTKNRKTTEQRTFCRKNIQKDECNERFNEEISRNEADRFREREKNPEL